MNIEELKKTVRGNGFQESHGSTMMVIDVETVIDLLDDLKQCDIPVVVGQSEQLRFLIDKFQTPKGNYLIDLLMEYKENKEKP